jgi:hypothetical protein
VSTPPAAPPGPNGQYRGLTPVFAPPATSLLETARTAWLNQAGALSLPAITCV